mmetsp:Transcript_5634/g.16110  ORF Transcript_5634/g.16110 Transcript_5634/m.16110 type:complete len:366 (-) Transcript_5634:479-1576(-)
MPGTNKPASDGYIKVRMCIGGHEEAATLQSQTPQQRSEWVSVQLPRASCTTRGELYSKLQQVHNLRGEGNPFRAEPDGLPSGYFEARLPSSGKQPRSRYLLIPAAASTDVLRRGNHGSAAAAAIDLSDATGADSPPTAGFSNGDLCVLVLRSSCRYCSAPVELRRNGDKTIKKRPVCADHRNLLESKTTGREWRSRHARLISTAKEADAAHNVQKRQKRIADHRVAPLPVAVEATKPAAATPAGRQRRRRQLRSRKNGKANAVKMTAEAATLALESDRLRKLTPCLSPVETPNQGSPEIPDALDTPAVVLEAVPGAQAASTTQSPDSTFDLEAFFGSTSHGWLGQGMCDFLVDGDDGDDPLAEWG